MSMESQSTIQQARLEAAATLRSAGIETAALDARVLMSHVLTLSPTQLLVRDPEPLSVADHHAYRELIARRVTGVPVAYLVGYREFMGLQFATVSDVLVPRPDTEPLVEWGLNWLKHHPQAIAADIGTGSGAIAISTVFHADPRWTGRMIATDISKQALAVARRNAESLLTAEKRSQLEFRSGSLTTPLTGPVDLLLTNLPYLTPDQIEENPDLRHEPSLALDGGEDGLDLVRIVIDDLPRVLAPGGAVGFEIDPSQASEVQRLLAAALPRHRIGIVPDLAGRERHVVADSRGDSNFL